MEPAPEGYYRVWQNGQLPPGGHPFPPGRVRWPVNPRTKGFHHDAYTGWLTILTASCSSTMTGTFYDMDRQEVNFVGGALLPGPGCPSRSPEQLTWNEEKGYAQLNELPYVYDPASGWLIDHGHRRLSRGLTTAGSYDGATDQLVSEGRHALHHGVQPH